MNNNEKFKVIMLGDPGVGKTNILRRYMGEIFQCHYPATIGVDFVRKSIKTDSQEYKIDIWDTSG